MTKLEVAAVYAGLNMLILLALGARAALRRQAGPAAHGNGADPAGYAPAAMIGLVFLALLDPARPWLVHAAGAALTAGGLLQLYGLAREPGPASARLAGMALTFLALAICGLGAIWAGLSPAL